MSEKPFLMISPVAANISTVAEILSPVELSLSPVKPILSPVEATTALKNKKPALIIRPASKKPYLVTILKINPAKRPELSSQSHAKPSPAARTSR